MDVTVVTVSRPETTATVTRGAGRLLVALGYAPLTEVTLPNGRRADLMALGPKGEIFIVEVKSSLEDFRCDQKWHEYQPYCCLLYTSDAADERSSVDLGGRRI